jgi:hypothetical protein
MLLIDMLKIIIFPEVPTFQTDNEKKKQNDKIIDVNRPKCHSSGLWSAW